MKFNTFFDHENPVVVDDTPSMTDRQYSQECDINYLMARFTQTGQLPVQPVEQGQFGDFSDVTSFQDVLDKVNVATEHFQTLPSDIRSRFGNNPAAFVDFITNPSNVSEATRLGLLRKPEETAPVSPSPASQAEPAPHGEGNA